MVVETIFLVTQSQCLMPLETELFPVLKPFHFGARLDEELHLHLLKLTHTEYKLTSNNLITECLTNLRYSERNLHAACLLYIEVVNENTLCCLRTEINLHCAIGGRTHLGLAHKIELSYVRPVACTTNRANNFLVQDNLFQLCQVIGIHCL